MKRVVRSSVRSDAPAGPGNERLSTLTVPPGVWKSPLLVRGPWQYVFAADKRSSGKATIGAAVRLDCVGPASRLPVDRPGR